MNATMKKPRTSGIVDPRSAGSGGEVTRSPF
jgi:hypothetical protein